MDQFVSKSYAYVKILVKLSKVYFEQIRPKCKCPLYKLYIIYIYFKLKSVSDGESTHPAASNPATSSQTRYSSPSNSSGQIDSSPIARSTIPPQPTIQTSPNINENVVNNNNLTNHSNAAQLQALQFAQSLQLAQSQLTNPLLSQQPFQLFGTGLPSVTTSNTSTILQQMQLQQHILQLRQNQQAVATNRERNNSASSGAIWRLADLANGESRSQDRQSDDDTPEPKKRKLEEGDDRPEE